MEALATMSVWDALILLDRSAFLAINELNAPWADTLMVFISEMWVWFPLYLLFLFFIQRRYGWVGMAIAVPVIAAMIFASDTGSVVLFKNTVHRLRPCHQPDLAGMVHLVNDHCGGRFGFISSHAANHFAIAAFMIAVIGSKGRWVVGLLVLWAVLVAYSRIYLGAHFPADVVVGGLFGALVGSVFFAIFRRIMNRKAT